MSSQAKKELVAQEKKACIKVHIKPTTQGGKRNKKAGIVVSKREREREKKGKEVVKGPSCPSACPSVCLLSIARSLASCCFFAWLIIRKDWRDDYPSIISYIH